MRLLCLCAALLAAVAPVRAQALEDALATQIQQFALKATQATA